MQNAPSEQPSVPWPEPLTRLPRALLALGAVLLSLSVMYVEFPGRPLILHSLQKLGHPLVFAGLTVVLFAIRRQRIPAGSLWGDYLPAICTALLLGLVTELSQAVTHRDPAIRDVMLDGRGILCAVALLLSVDPRMNPYRSRRVRAALLSIVAVILAISLAPVAWVGAAYLNRMVLAPTLFAPRSDLDLLLVSLTDIAPDIGSIPAAFARQSGEKALRVPLTNRPYAGVSLDEPFADWRGHQYLEIDVTNPTRSELNLHIRIQDRWHNGNVSDRFESTERLQANVRRTISIPLQKIAAAPHGRPLDLAQVAGVFLYKAGGEGAREIWLGRIALQ